MKRVISILLCLMFILSLCACGNSSQKSESNKGESSKSEFETISTPYADLRVPSSLSENVTHEVSEKNPYTLSFKADGTELFSFVFNGKGETLSGTIVNGDKKTTLYVNMAKLDAKDKNYAKYSDYQEESGDIIRNLKDDYEFISGQAAEDDHSADTFDIKTKVVTLKYPAVWKDTIQYQGGENDVKFTAYNQPMFDISFVEVKDGVLIGYYDNTPIYLVTYKLDQKKLSAEQYQNARTMQDDVNVMLDFIREDKKFSKTAMVEG